MHFINEKEWKYNDEYKMNVYNGVTVDTAFSGDVQERLIKLEDDSWWFKYRSEVIIRLMNDYYDKNTLTLDIGGGNGYTSSRAMSKGYNVGIIEPSIVACRNARNRGLVEVNCGSVSDSSIIDGSINQAMLLDVLEHIEDDNAFLDILHRKMAHNGCLLITVPAFLCLWSSEDNLAGHYRRYRVNELCELLEKHGFTVHYSSYFMGFLFFPILIFRVGLEKIGLIKKCEDRSEEEHTKIAEKQFKTRFKVVDLVLLLVESIEKKLMKSARRVPFGSSVIVAARKE